MSSGRGPLFAAALALALVLAAPAAGDSIGSQKAAVDTHIADLQGRIGASRRDEGVLTSQLSEVAGELRSAQDAVDTAQATLDDLESRLASQRAALARLTARLQRQTLRLQRLRAQYARAIAVLETRVREIYMQGSPDVVSLLVSATSFSDLIDNYDFLRRIGVQDEHIAHDVRAAKARAAAERRATLETRRLTAATVDAISAKTEEARAVRDKLAASRDSLASAEQLKSSALSDVRETRADYLAEVNALQAQSAALTAAIRNAQGGAATGGSGSSSGLIWPVNGPITSGFGTRWGRMHEGIDIAVPSGTPVHAAASGTVIYAAWMTGYGNLVVLDHGNGLATAYAHNSSLLVSVGQHVSQGQTISLSGSTGHSTGPHVHFEVRVNGVAVDPLNYL
jgi:murein DD-endopeptidase MepM/ murein hydrolase activator NlpD